MTFSIPNTPEASPNVDLAEPDAGDFQSLGDRVSGVLSGGAAVKNGANNVDVSAVSGYLNGVFFDITTATTSLGVTPPGAGESKFSLVLVSESAGVFSLEVLQGTTGNGGLSSTNARYPSFASTNKLLLAVVYHFSGDAAITSVVDKRIIVMPQSNPKSVASLDTAAVGEMRILTTGTPAAGQSRVWVLESTGTWVNLAAYSGTTIINPYTGTNTPVDFRITDFGVSINDAGGPGTNALKVGGTTLLVGHLDGTTSTFSGNVTAPTFVGSLSGNATTASSTPNATNATYATTAGSATSATSAASATTAASADYATSAGSVPDNTHRHGAVKRIYVQATTPTGMENNDIWIDTT